MGLNALATYEVVLENWLPFPFRAKLGGEKGSDVTKLLSYSRVGLGGLAVGLARSPTPIP